jgi:hypothetical protein
VMLTQTCLRELLDYDPITGVFRYRKSSRRGWSGKVAGSIKPGTSGGYRLIVVDGERFRASRLAWLYMTGTWPDEDVDHIDRNRSNDVWSNLRLATRSQNMANGHIRSTNTSGYRGVTWDERTGKWRAQVVHNYRNFYCGLHDTPEQAAQARDAKAVKLHGEYTRLSTRRLS